MTKSSIRAFSALGIVLLFSCSSSSPNGLLGDGDVSQQARGGGTGAGANGTKKSGGAMASGSSTGLLVVVTGSSVGSGLGSGQGGGAARQSSNLGSELWGEVGGGSADGGGSTTDPAPPQGGMGFTTDPAPPAGGSGETTDPPPGDTKDPPPGDTQDRPPGDTADPPPGDTKDPPPGDTPDPPPGDTPDPPPGDTPDPPTECTMTEIDKVNVIVFEDATPTGADAEGRMWVGGNLKADHYAIATTSLTEAKATCSDWGLVVGGNITGNPLVKGGKLAYGGTLSGNPESSCGIFHEKPVDFDALEVKLTGYSAAFRDYPANGTAVVTYSQLVLTGTDPKLNVFSIAGEVLSTITNVKFVVPTTSSVIVNISGKTANWQGGDFTLPDGGKACKNETSAWCHRILYNFYEATDVTINGIGIQGSILAPYATFNGKGGNVDGQVIVKYLNGVTEYHPYFFSGCLLLPKPKS